MDFLKLVIRISTLLRHLQIHDALYGPYQRCFVVLVIWNAQEAEWPRVCENGHPKILILFTTFSS
jgi:hypothetical protein